MKKRALSILLTAAMAVTLLAGCGSSESTDEKTENTETDGEEEKPTLTYGKSYGPFTELFEDAIRPIMEEQGYTFEVVNVDDVIQNDTALMDGDVDFNVEQHEPYINTFNESYDAELMATAIHLPTMPYFLFSNSYESIDEIEDGASLLIAVPNDGSNLPRALALCELAGLLTLDPDVSKDEVTYDDIIETPYDIEWNEMDTTTIPTILDDVDFGLITGGNLVNAGMKAADAFCCETEISADMQIRIAIRSEDADEEWVADLEAAYTSDEFKAYMDEHQSDYSWIVPEDLFQ